MRTLNEQEKQRVLFIVADTLGYFEEEIDDDNSLKDDLGMDSLDQVEICMEIEKEFNINIPDSELENVKTVQDLYSCVEKFL
jgi:acyl carrier protein